MPRAYWTWEQVVNRYEKKVKGIKSLFVSTVPSTTLIEGSNSACCNEVTVHYCKAYCCSSRIGKAPISPLEIAVISKDKKIAPSSFVTKRINTTVFGEGKVEVNPLFGIRHKKDYCVFNAHDYTCSVYDVRPITCRTYPYDVDKLNRPCQQRTCAAYSQGTVLTEQDIKELKTGIYVAYALRIAAYDVREYVPTKNTYYHLNNNSDVVIKSVLEEFGIPYDTPVEHFKLEDICNKMYELTTLAKDLEKFNINKETFFKCLGCK